MPTTVSDDRPHTLRGERIDVYDAMRTLRAVRRLRPDSIADEVLERVLEAATWAPTGGNAQPWRIVLVRDAPAKRRLGELYAGSWSRFSGRYAKRIEAPPADEQPRHRRTMAAGDYLAAHFHEAPVLAVFCFDPSEMAITDASLDRVSVVGGASIYPAVQNFLLACRAEGLGCVLTTLLCAHEQEVRAILEIPEPWGTAAVVPVGYPLLGGHGPLRRRSVRELVYDERFGRSHAPTRERS
jgi:nitroreductase